MKRSLSILLAILVFSCSQKLQKDVVKIPDLRKEKLPELDPASHKHHEVEVHRTTFFKDVYAISFYRNDEGVLKGYRAYVGIEHNYYKASVHWTDDSTVQVKFLDPSGEGSKIYTVSGHGSTTTLSTPDEENNGDKKIVK